MAIYRYANSKLAPHCQMKTVDYIIPFTFGIVKGILHYVSCSFGLDYGIPYGTLIILMGRLIQTACYKWRNIIT